MKTKMWIAAGAAAVAGCLYLMNASWLAPKPTTRPLLLAHRGIYQHYDRTGLTNQTCTASRMLPPVNNFLENTLPSIRAGLEAGAGVTEIDVHSTLDGQFVVFHDWTLDCRTDGHGVTDQHTLAELKAVDIGYGYTADNGRTYPFRGQFKGQMPSLKEALDAFPNERFLINIKSNDPAEADKLVTYLKANGEMSPRLQAYGSGRPIPRLAHIAPSLRPFDVKSLKACGFSYLALGWSGYMPKACRNTTMLLPQNMTWMVWGYPNRLQDRFARAGSYIYLLGPQKGKVGLSGVNTPEQLARVPKDWGMGILTDSIESIGPLVKAREAAP